MRKILKPDEATVVTSHESQQGFTNPGHVAFGTLAHEYRHDIPKRHLEECHNSIHKTQQNNLAVKYSQGLCVHACLF